MQLEVVVSVAVGVWVLVLLLAITVCRAATRSDEAMSAALASAERDDDLDDAITRPQARSLQTPLRILDLDNAAALLDVSPETLLAWEARYGFPSSSPPEPRYNESEVLALRDSLARSASISSAITQAREKIRRRRAPTSARVADHRDGGLAS